jgi:hypothetical protein
MHNTDEQSFRYLQLFTPIEPTVHNICNFNFEKQASKIRDLRPDTLGQIMLLANVRPGGRLLVVEDLHGMIVAAAVERMGGESIPTPQQRSILTGMLLARRSGRDHGHQRRRLTSRLPPPRILQLLPL